MNADIDAIDVSMLPERHEAVNLIGMKGIGELGVVGMNAVIANAVYHATGHHTRHLAIRLDDLL